MLLYKTKEEVCTKTDTPISFVHINFINHPIDFFFIDTGTSLINVALFEAVLFL
jgi:hypothetical protein